MSLDVTGQPKPGKQRPPASQFSLFEKIAFGCLLTLTIIGAIFLILLYTKRKR